MLGETVRKVETVSVKYRNPPINELIIGAYFDQPISLLRAEHVGLFWSMIRKEFPKIRQQPELPLPIGNLPIGGSIAIQIGSSDEVYPLPRFWLENEAMLLQIQRNAFILNWRKRDSDYPHFENVKKLFDKFLNKFSKFIKNEIFIDIPNINISELTYINLINSNEYWKDTSDTSNLIPGIKILDPGISAGEKPDFNYLTAYKFARDLSMHVGVRSGRVATEANKPALVLELRALGMLGGVGRKDADAWFARAHEAIGHCFTSITNPDIQHRYWQPM